ALLPASRHAVTGAFLVLRLRRRIDYKIATGHVRRGLRMTGVFPPERPHAAARRGALVAAITLLTMERVDLDVPRLHRRAGTPPESFFEKIRERDRDAARKFYAKYLDINGLPVAASAEVADEALLRTHEIVTHLLAGRPDIVQAMVKNGTRLIIIGKEQVSAQRRGSAHHHPRGAQGV